MKNCIIIFSICIILNFIFTSNYMVKASQDKQSISDELEIKTLPEENILDNDLILDFSEYSIEAELIIDDEISGRQNIRTLSLIDPLVERIEGENRVETSILVSKKAYKNGSKSLIIVGYNGAVDALTGTILAVKEDSPILISDKNTLSSNLINEINRLNPDEIFILGGEKVVSKSIENELRNINSNIKRISGESREDTAINIANFALKEESSEVFLSLGYNIFADALAIGPVAAKNNIPLLLTKSDKIKDSTLDYLESKNIKKVNIIGGEKAVNESVEEVLKLKGIKTERINGSSREETALLIAKKYINTPSKIILASGYKYYDAIVGGYLSIKENAPILLTKADNLKEINKDFIKENNLSTIILGGSLSINKKVEKDLEVALGITKKDIAKNLIDLKRFINKELDFFNPEISIEYDGDIKVDDVTKIIKNIFRQGNYISGVIKKVKYGISSEGGSSFVHMSVEYFHGKEEEEFINNEVKGIVKQIIKPKMSDFEKVKTIHDYIINNSYYSDHKDPSPHSPYKIFKEGRGVCQAYTLATYKLLEEAGIMSYYVTGTADNGKGRACHVWNLVNIDGEYYHLDVTWDDPIYSSGKNGLRYDYFLISEEKISASHEMKQNTFPKATNKQYEGRVFKLAF